MTRRVMLLAAALPLAGAGAGVAVAAPVSVSRFALVVGNNHGDGSRYGDLRHAEDDARRVHDVLTRDGGFRREHVELVTGGDRATVLEAAARLRAAAVRARRDVPEPRTLFVLYFSGHALAGELLTRAGRLGGAEIGGVLESMGGDVNVVIFDACEPPVSLKGPRVLDENPLHALPAELLRSEGTMLLLSSDTDEVSIEDGDLGGGVFTHFFLDGFARAPGDATGIALDDIWEHARRHTSAWAARKGLRQSPLRKFGRGGQEFAERAPIYLRVHARSARIRFAAALAGTFVLDYEDGWLAERFDKAAGRAEDVPVVPGTVTLRRLAGPGDADRAWELARVRIEPGATYRVGPGEVQRAAALPGWGRALVKGGASVQIAAEDVRTMLAVEPGWRTVASDPGLAAPRHAAVIGLRGARGAWSLGMELGLGTQARRFATWGYAMRALDVRVIGGYGFDLGWSRLDVEAGGGPAFARVAYEDGSAARTPAGGWLGAGARWVVPVTDWLHVTARGALGVRFAQGLGAADRRTYASFAPDVGIALSFPLDMSPRLIAAGGD